MADVSHISSAVVAPILLSISLFGCRDEHLASHAQESEAMREPSIVRSLEGVAEQPQGTKVYLSNVFLSALAMPGTNSEVAYFMVSDGRGNRALTELAVAPSSMLWALVPDRGDRPFQDFGATVEVRGTNRVLSLFKLGN